VAKDGKSGPAGGASFNFDGKAIADAIVTGCAQGTLMGLQQLQREVKTTLSQAGTGIKWPGLPTRSSAPGRPPVSQTGNLRRSWQTGQPQRVAADRRLGWSIGSNQPYAKLLEFGSARIFSRPYLRPSIRTIAKTLGATVSAQIGKALKQAGFRSR
jgi:hypothetical protein